MKRLGLIVEGHGDQKALPILVRRIAHEILDSEGCTILEPHRLKRGLMDKNTELTRAVDLVARKVGNDGAILIVLDADDDKGCVIAPSILEKARAARSDRRIGVVAAVREYEAWLIAGIAPLVGTFGIDTDLPAVENVETLSSPKAWLRRYMDAYAETVDQAKLTRAFDLSLARRTYSFDKLVRELSRLLDLDLVPHSA